MSATEDGVTDLMADYLRQKGIKTATQISISSPNSRSQPDFQISNGGKFVGEAKWEDNKWEGFAEARDYSHLPGVKGSFLIAYPTELKSKASQSRLGGNAAESILSGHKFSCAFLRRDTDTDTATLELEEIPEWINSNIKQQRKPKADTNQVVDVLRQCAFELNEELQTAPEEDIFRNVLGATPDEEKEKEAARETAGFLLVNQITFYRVLSSNKNFPDIKPNELATPSELDRYFEEVLKVDYTPVFSFKISDGLPQESLTILKDAIKSIYALSPERVNHDVLGKVFHELIPVSSRKKVAAYYTMSKAGEILASLAIDSADTTVLEPACGSGTLLAASYIRKRELLDGFTEDDHRRFLEEELTGLDVMPFAAHLSCIHLALQAPVYETDEVNIGIADSTRLNPGDKISPLSFVRPESQRQSGLADFDGENSEAEKELVESGSVAMDAVAGKEMELKKADVVMMNPPYSRQESIARFAEGYKSDLHNQFSRRESKGQLHGKMSFCSYFMFLADKFLDKGGRIAAVLPASILNKTSDKGVREMLLEEYTIEHIVAREDGSSLSEDTELREILLVAKKGQPDSESSTTYITLDGLDTDVEELKEKVEESKKGEIKPSIGYSGGGGTTSEFTVRRFKSDTLETHNLFSPLAVQNFELFELWDEIKVNDKLDFIENVDTGLTGGSGGGIPYWNEGVLNAPHSYLRDDDVWVVDDDSGDSVEATHKHLKESIEIPKSALEHYFHRYARREYSDISNLPEYTVVRDFDNVERFLQMVEMDEIPNGWEGHINRRKAHLGVSDRYNFTAPGTRHMAFYSDEQRMYHRMWMFPDIDKQTAKGYATWLDSSIGVLQFLIQRVPYQGGWGKYHRHTLAKFKVPNPQIADSEIKTLAGAMNEYGKESFPSLSKQVARNVDKSELTSRQLNEIKLQFEDIEQELGEGFEPRKEIDKLVLKELGMDSQRREDILSRIYPALLGELAKLKELMN